MTKIPLVICLSICVFACKKNDLPKEEEKMRLRSSISNTATNEICDQVTLNVYNKTVTIKGVNYLYPADLFDMTNFPHDFFGNAVLKTNCIDMSSATSWQIQMHQRNDSLFGIAASVFSTLNKPKAPPQAPYTMQEFEYAMDNTPWVNGTDGAEYVSTIFNNVIRKSTDVQALPGISSALMGPALLQNKNFRQLSLEQAILQTNRAEAFVIAVGLMSPGVPGVTIIDHRFFRTNCGTCEPIEQISGRQSNESAVRLSSFFDYNSAHLIKYFTYVRVD